MKDYVHIGSTQKERRSNSESATPAILEHSKIVRSSSRHLKTLEHDLDNVVVRSLPLTSREIFKLMAKLDDAKAILWSMADRKAQNEQHDIRQVQGTGTEGLSDPPF